ncbi:SET domain-containing protein [Neoconidiobolus thromboides FSU 785]|nr:SET domain-containing protein [Neoconidiobolus thromboides FSU 785]
MRWTLYWVEGKINRIEYLVRWKGYSPNDDTWEPKKNLSCKESIEAFESSIEHLFLNRIGEDETEYMKNNKKNKLNIKQTMVLPSNIAKFYELVSKDSGPAISVVNTIDDEGPPKDFTFIDKNIYPKGVVVQSELSCDCKGNCGESDNCACVLLNEGIPYDKKGIIQAALNEGIYECNSRCACSKDCQFRVVQKGRTVRLQVFKTKNKGWGIKALDFIPEGRFVEEYVGEVITDEVAEERGKKYDSRGLTYLFDLDFSNGPTGDCEYVIDAFKYGNLSHFFNHSCDPNIAVIPVLIDNQNISLHRLAFFSIRDIYPDEEVCFDYSFGVESHTESANKEVLKSKYPCYCRSSNCRGIVHLY